MEVVILADAKEIGGVAADAIGALLDRKPDAVLGLATGSSPLAIYDELAARCEAGAVSFRQARGFTLDEYVGLPADHPAAVPDRHRRRCSSPGSTSPRARSRARTAWPPTSPPRARRTRTRSAQAGGVDLQILGIGTDGHIAFNEPGSSLASRTRIKTLTRQTRIDNARFFGGDVDAVPTHCLTQGLATIMEARHVILVATGRGKAEAVHHLVEGAGERAVAGDHPAAPPARHGAARRRRRPPASARRLLPRDLPLQAGMAGHLSAADRRHPAHGPRTVAARVD